jgi:hypothetical protein
MTPGSVPKKGGDGGTGVCMWQGTTSRVMAVEGLMVSFMVVTASVRNILDNITFILATFRLTSRYDYYNIILSTGNQQVRMTNQKAIKKPDKCRYIDRNVTVSCVVDVTNCVMSAHGEGT